MNVGYPTNSSSPPSPDSAPLTRPGRMLGERQRNFGDTGARGESTIPFMDAIGSQARSLLRERVTALGRSSVVLARTLLETPGRTTVTGDEIEWQR
jgi:hypothetical protein